LPNTKPPVPGPGIPGLVSVIIPTYNRGDIIGETIASVLAQTYPQFEILLIDDGSTDNTRQVVSAIDDKRLRYFYKENGGTSAARNSGLDSARGEFIAFLDHDDLWESWKLEAQLEILRRHADAGLVWSDMSSFAKVGEILSERHLREYYSAYSLVNLEAIHKPVGTLSDLGAGAPEKFAGCPYYVADVFEYMFNGNLVHPPTAVVRRERLQKSGWFEPQVTGFGAEDYHFYFRVCSHGPVAFLDAPTMLYRIHASQISTTRSLQEARGNLNVVKHWMGRRPANVPEPVIQRALANSHAWLGEEELRAGSPRAATRHLWQSLRLRKAQPYTIRLLLMSLVPLPAVQFLRVLKRGMQSAFARPAQL
jgi:glycosyltransferase involved in cell wall biosynthesis